MKLLIPALMSLLAGFSYSQNWRGTVDANWNNPANWSAWPLNNQDITIDPANYTGAALHPVISSNSVFSPAQVLIANGGQVTISANLTTTDDVECTGPSSQLVVNAGTFSVNPGDGGRLIIDLGATMVLNNGNVLVDERFIAGEDATVTIEGGSATSGERLLMDLGGQFHQNGGSVSVASVFAVADGSANRPSGYVLNNGSLLVGGEFGLETESGSFFPFFEQNGGTATINASVSWLGAVPGAGRGYFTVNNGVANVNGVMENTAGSTMNMQIEVHNAGTLNLNGSLVHLLLPGDSLVQTGASQVNVLTNLTIQNTGVIDCISGMLTLDANADLQGTGSFQLDNVFISSGRTLTHSTSGDLRVSGDLVTDGVYLAQNHRMILNGSDLQTLSGLQSFYPFSLTLENTSTGGVILETGVTLNGDLTLTNGKLHTSAAHLLKLTAGATSSTGNAQSFVSGPMEKAGNTAFVFPLGKDDRWARIAISAPSSVSDVFRAEYFHSANPSLSPVSSPLSAVSGIEYWNVSQTSGSSSVQLSFFWENASASAITDCSELSIAQWSGSSWQNVVSTASGVCSGTGSGFVTSSSAVSTYGDFTFGFYGGVTTQAVQLCSGDTLIVGTSSYSSSGTYVDILQDVTMSDSVVITYLTVVVPNIGFTFADSTLSVAAISPQAIQWIDCSQSATVGTSAGFTPAQSGIFSLAVTENGCSDTTDCFYFTYGDTTICGGSVLDFAGLQITAPGTYAGLLASSAGADSIVSIYVTVFQVNTAISYDENTIWSMNTAADSYTWFNCDSMTIVPGVSGPVFDVVDPGGYALIISESGCMDTSDCVYLSLWGLDESTLTAAVKFYPNPAAGDMNVLAEENGVLTIYTASGQLVDRKACLAGVPSRIGLGAGVYVVEYTTTAGARRIERLVFR